MKLYSESKGEINTQTWKEICQCTCLATSVKRNSLRDKESDTGQALEIHQEKKSIREGVNKGKTKSFIFPTLDWSDNSLFK